MRVLSMSSGRWLLVVGLGVIGSVALDGRAFAQGCMPATPQPLAQVLAFETKALSSVEEDDSEPLFQSESAETDVSIDPAAGASSEAAREELAKTRTARDLQILKARAWSFSASFRYYKSGDSYVGSDQVDKNVAIGDYPSLNLAGTYSFNDRWNLSVALPIVNPRDEFEHGDGNRHTIGPGVSIGDLRVTGSYWVFDPTRPRPGNVVLGLGIKAPTGKYDVEDTYFTPDGEVVLPADLAVQPGDGGWGLILATQGFQAVARRTYFYGDGFYLVNPRDTNGTVTETALFFFGEPIPLSVPDYYQVRAGFGYQAWPKRGISLSLGLRLDGIPTEDLVGDSNGYRRPGYNLAIDPGITVSWGRHIFSLYVPVAIARAQNPSLPEQERDLHFGGSMASEALMLYYARRF